MEAIQSFAARVRTALDGLAGDVDWLKAKIEELQRSPGTLTPEDQATLDEIQARVELMDSQTARPLVPNP